MNKNNNNNNNVAFRGTVGEPDTTERGVGGNL